MSENQDAIDIKTGRNALMYYHRQSTYFAGFNYSFADFLKQYGDKSETYQKVIGLNIRLNELSDTDVRKTMEGLADVGQGRIPDKTDIIRALGIAAQQNNVEGFDFTGFVKAVAGDVVTGAQKVGDSVITSASWILNILPFLVVGAVIFIVAKHSKQIADVDVKSLVTKARKKIIKSES